MANKVFKLPKTKAVVEASVAPAVFFIKSLRFIVKNFNENLG
jgi:hypothetical protein